MISVDEALAEIRKAAAPLNVERVAIGDAAGRVLATDVTAAVSQPPFRSSAMDGYAVRFADARTGGTLKVVGEAAAGKPFTGEIGAGEAARIFTGGVVPPGADHVVIQEDVTAGGGAIVIMSEQARPSNIREAGIDFRAGVAIRKAGARLKPADLGLIASANVAEIAVRRRPVVAFFDNGDELVEPGAALRDGEIVGSLRFAFAPLIAAWGAVPRYVGRAGDDRAAIRRLFDQAKDADALVTIGGASVGDHDHVRAAFAEAGGAMIFSKVSVKPGKPTWFGALGACRVLGLPGNPASAIVCANLFLRPLVSALSGAGDGTLRLRAALHGSLGANGARESFLRGRIEAIDDGRLRVTPFRNQDSSLLTPLAEGNCLIRRLADAPATQEGDLVDCLLLAPVVSTP